MQNQRYTIGVDVGGTNTSVGIVDHTETLLITSSSFATKKESTAERFIDMLASTIKDLSEKAVPGQKLRGIAVAAPAAVRHMGTIQSPANLNWGTIDIVSMLKKYYDIPVAVMNDSNATALGEMKSGLARGVKNFIVVTMGTGLGSGIVVDGRLLYGEHGVAGELGHTTVKPGGRMCGCNRRGCAETYVSATGIRRTVFELLANSTEHSELREISFSQLTAGKIHALALQGDPLAISAFDITGDILGRTLANAVALFDPAKIILSGGLMNAGDLLLAPTVKSFNENVLDIHKNRVDIVRSQLKDGEAAIIGACSLFDDVVPPTHRESTGKHQAHSESAVLKAQE
ncbi:MAG TPA: ROK family protein [Bacteroidota bacterium]|nr:ROK family protein [Bacteroidota bacterium]